MTSATTPAITLPTATAPLNLDQLHLASGSHDSRGDGMCLLEAVAWYAGNDHTDMPRCVSPVLRDFGMRLNDVLGDERRQQLKPLIPVLIGTAGDGHDRARPYLALDWLIRTYTPAWLDLAGLVDEARHLRGLRHITDEPAARQAGGAVRHAKESAVAAQAAAWSTAWTGAWAAAEKAIWEAALAAARAGAAGAAAGAAGAAGAAARAAAGAAAQTAARHSIRAAAWDLLSPTVDTLQISAIQLYRTMIRPADIT